MSGKTLIIEWELPSELTAIMLHAELKPFKELGFRILMSNGSGFENNENLNKFELLKDDVIDEFFAEGSGAGKVEFPNIKNHYYIYCTQSSSDNHWENSIFIGNVNREDGHFGFLATNLAELRNAFAMIIEVNSDKKRETIDQYNSDFLSKAALVINSSHRRNALSFVGTLLISFGIFALCLWGIKISLLASLFVGFIAGVITAVILACVFNMPAKNTRINSLLSSSEAPRPQYAPSLALSELKIDSAGKLYILAYDRFRTLMQSLRLYLWVPGSQDGKSYQYYRDLFQISLRTNLDKMKNPQHLLTQFETEARCSTHTAEQRFRLLADICRVTLIDSKVLFSCDSRFQDSFKVEVRRNFGNAATSTYLPEKWGKIPKFLPSATINITSLMNQRKKNPYLVLGIGLGASNEEIRTAYAAKIKGQTSDTEFRDINESYLLLSDEFYRGTINLMLSLENTLPDLSKVPLSPISLSSAPKVA